MVDTTLRPRPTFGTFLQSDNSTKDGLSYFEYQRLLRSKKVALLQKKKEGSYEPGYKKQSSSFTNSSGPISRKIFQLKVKDPATLKSILSQTQGQNDVRLETISKAQLASTHQLPKVDSSNNRSVQLDEPTDQSERLPRIKTRVRMVKSATARDYPLSSPSHVTHSLHERPKTVGGMRDLSALANQAKGECLQHINYMFCL